jgi:hypothetical protein
MSTGGAARAGAWLHTLKGLGVRNLSLRALHTARMRAGWYQRTLPVSEWQDLAPWIIESARPIFAVPSRTTIQPHIHEPEAAVEASHRIASGECLYFSSQWLKRPTDWRTNPQTEGSTPLKHWSELHSFGGADQGDVKWIWEPSRFDWVYQLGRGWAAAATDKEANQIAEVFWGLLVDWRAHNPPNQGINWVCGQECAFRLLALVWAASTLGQAPSSTPERMALLWGTVEALAHRIDQAMAYALSQNNNHGLSEAAALLLAGTALPGHPLAGQWCAKGLRNFLTEMDRQFETDGGYAQHSMNYMRVALRDAFVVVTALSFDEDGVPPRMRDRILASAELLFQVQDPDHGQVPNYGPNDGANILSLSSCPYEDYRPLLQLLSWQLDRRRIFEAGPWDEELAWHFDPPQNPIVIEPRRRRSFGREESGYFGIRGERSFAMIRCHSFVNRPGDADMLHLDLWMDGINVLPDRGSYSYNDPKDWGQALRGTASHNTVTVDAKNQMTVGSRFLWLNWTQSQLHSFGRHQIASWDGWIFDGEHTGYVNGPEGVTHRRRVLYREEEWVVIDDLTPMDKNSHELTLRWLVHKDAPASFSITTFGPGDESILEGPDHLPQNGVSRTYGELTPHRLLVRKAHATGPVRWVTVIGANVPSPTDRLLWKGLDISLQPGSEIS